MHPTFFRASSLRLEFCGAELGVAHKRHDMALEQLEKDGGLCARQISDALQILGYDTKEVWRTRLDNREALKTQSDFENIRVQTSENESLLAPWLRLSA
jgi:hypothetical protein